MWEPQHLETLWASTAFYRDSFISYINKSLGNVKQYMEPLRELGKKKGGGREDTIEIV
jgi:hypothetical protein